MYEILPWLEIKLSKTAGVHFLSKNLSTKDSCWLAVLKETVEFWILQNTWKCAETP